MSVEVRIARRRDFGGSQLFVLALLLLALAGGGAFNYHRNLQAESEDKGPRPFEAYSDTELEALASAYEQEAKAMRAQYDQVRLRGAGVKDTHLLADGIVEFERVQQSSARMRSAGSRVADREVTVDQIREEQKFRASDAEGMALHLRRLFSL